MDNVKLECFCGKLKGNLSVDSNKKSFHVHCLCDDCQNYAGILKNEAKILDQYGGTELFQTFPSHLTISEGIEALVCLQLRKNGLLRWYSSCCNAPIGNTMNSAKMPFVGVFVKTLRFSSEEEKQKILGPVIMKAFGKFARGQKPPEAYDLFPKIFIFRIIGFILRGFIKKGNSPSPFFTDMTPIVAPKVIS